MAIPKIHPAPLLLPGPILSVDSESLLLVPTQFVLALLDFRQKLSHFLHLLHVFHSQPDQVLSVTKQLVDQHVRRHPAQSVSL